MNEKIETDSIMQFAVVVCDLNDLKTVNDTKGHIEGDKSIQNACVLLCETFEHSPVFRIGGDEFAVLLTGDDYEKRHDLLEQIDQQMREFQSDPGKSLAIGMSDYVRGEDSSVMEVFTRADRIMYQRKNALKVLLGRI